MAIVHDVIPPFQLFQPTSLDEALDLAAARGREAWVLAGGMDSLDWLKDRTRRTSVVIELGQVAELHGIRDVAGGLEIGAMTTLTEVAEHAVVRARFAGLAEAASLVASPQIRNQGTLGGNVSQDTRCAYYRRTNRITCWCTQSCCEKDQCSSTCCFTCCSFNIIARCTH